MGEIAEFPLATRLLLHAYPWRRIDPVPWTPLRRPLPDATVALVSSAGLVLPEQEAFDDEVRGGDWTWRDIPGDVEVATLRDTHRSESYDHAGIAADRNLAFPLDRLRELCTAGAIGAVSRRHVSIMGSITAPGRLIARTAPQIAAGLVEAGVDVGLFVPV